MRGGETDRVLPHRGPTVHELELPLPPPGSLVHESRRPVGMPSFLARRPLKRWRYVGVYGPDLMLCVGDARIGRVPQRWWAVALPDGRIHGRTTIGSGGVSLGHGRVRVDAAEARIELSLSESEGGEPVESVSPSGGGGWVWTRKQAGIPAAGMVEIGSEDWRVEAMAVIDDTAGYHRRDTEWRWSAGVGITGDGRNVGWNLVDGVNDDLEASERTLWVDGKPSELGPVAFAGDLASVAFAEGGELRFHEWSAREHSLNALLVRTQYRQPFGTFSGELPGGLELAQGHGAMEWHEVRW